MTKSYPFDVIEKEIADVFRRLSEQYPNASFVYSYVYATDKDPKKAEAKGRMSMCGSVEEVQTHLDGLTEQVQKQVNRGAARKDKVYGRRTKNKQ